MELLNNYFASVTFMPHGHCYLWKPTLVWLHITSDSLTAMSYYSIPATLAYLVKKRKDLPFNWVFILFGSFIILCGSTHVMEIWTLWYPSYWQSGLLKAITALISLVTALNLIYLFPKVLALPSQAQLEAEIVERKRAESEVRTLNAELEERVQARTQELLTTNLELKTEITQRHHAEAALQKAKDELGIRVEERTAELSQMVKDLQNQIIERQRVEENLRAMQKQMILQEKLVSLGNLTAGIAHEIRNPLNFVTNFAQISEELTEELVEEIQNQKSQLAPESTEYIGEILNYLKQNVIKINEHGQRAARTVSNMLLHAHGGKPERSEININTLLAEAINLAYHGMRGNDTNFNITIKTDYDNSIESVAVVIHDLNRALINIINNACYSVKEKKKEIGENFSPLLYIQTKNLGDSIQILIEDNGKGMTQEVLDKVPTPFFTTKPAGEGTGLGLSLTHDIIVQQHGGQLKVKTLVGQYAKFIIILPKKLP